MCINFFNVKYLQTNDTYTIHISEQYYAISRPVYFQFL